MSRAIVFSLTTNVSRAPRSLFLEKIATLLLATNREHMTSRIANRFVGASLSRRFVVRIANEQKKIP
jgi:hypothetical protein